LPAISLVLSAACVRAWKHVLLNEWASLDPTLTEADPLPYWITALHKAPEMDLNEAENVLFWCLGKQPPPSVEEEEDQLDMILRRTILSEMRSLGNEKTPAVSSDVTSSFEKEKSTTATASPSSSSSSSTATKMEPFPEVSTINVIDSQHTSAESTIYSDFLATLAPGSENVDNISSGGIVAADNQTQQQQVDHNDTPVVDPPTVDDTNKPTKPKPSTQPETQPPLDQNSSSSSSGTSSGTSSKSPILTPGTDGTEEVSSTDGGNVTNPVENPAPPPNPDDSHNSDSSNSGDGNGDGNGDGSTDGASPVDPVIIIHDSGSADASDNSSNDGENNDSKDGKDESSQNQQDGGSTGENTENSDQEESNNDKKPTSVEDWATPGNYKPVIIDPEYTLVDLSADDIMNSGVADDMVVVEDPGHLLTAGDGTATTLDTITVAPTTAEDASALPQQAMSTNGSVCGGGQHTWLVLTMTTLATLLVAFGF
jgi:hypothetical protein